jgi:hypothetical protein
MSGQQPRKISDLRATFVTGVDATVAAGAVVFALAVAMWPGA